MSTSIIPSRLPCRLRACVPCHPDSVLGFVLLLSVSVTLAPATGCEPTTPRGVTAPRSAPDADAAINDKGGGPDAAAETPRSTTALANAAGDASAERSMSASGSGGMPGCAPIGPPPTSDAGTGATPPADANPGDVVRSVGANSVATDAGHGDSSAVGTLTPGGASAGPMGGDSGDNPGGGGAGGAGGKIDGGAQGGHGNGGNAGAAIGGGGVLGVGGNGGAVGGRGGGGGVNSAPAPGAGDLAIVELLINPAGTDTGREWIEILNRTTHALDLSGLSISDAANTAAVTFATGTTTAAILPAGAWAVLIQSGDPAKNGGVTVDNTRPVGSFGTLVSLNNDADTISICFGPCANGTVIDSVSWDATLGTGYDGHALVIDDAGRRCPAAFPFGDAGSFGSPGLGNARCP